jgi:hypothetical protein
MSTKLLQSIYTVIEAGGRRPLGDETVVHFPRYNGVIVKTLKHGTQAVENVKSGIYHDGLVITRMSNNNTSYLINSWTIHDGNVSFNYIARVLNGRISCCVINCFGLGTRVIHGGEEADTYVQEMMKDYVLAMPDFQWDSADQVTTMIAPEDGGKKELPLSFIRRQLVEMAIQEECGYH